MPSGRTQRPLFDLISPRDGAPDSVPRSTATQSKPTVRIELKPRETSAPIPAETRTAARPEPAPAPKPQPQPAATGSTSSAALGAVLGDETVRLPRNAVWLAIPAALIIALFAWIAGVSRGERNAEKKLDSQFPKDVPAAISEPVTKPPTFSQIPVTGSKPTAPTTPNTSSIVNPSQTQTPGTIQTPTQPLGNSASLDTSRAILTGKGLQIGDPREKGLNYCRLAVLPRDDAQRAVDFLETNGIAAVGVPVDSAGKVINNLGPNPNYAIYPLVGLRKEDLKKSVQTNLEARVTQIGQVWQKEHRGTSNFAKFLWEKNQ